MNTETVAVTVQSSESDHNAQYEIFSRQIRGTFDERTKGNPPLFKTDAAGLFDLFLEKLAPEYRQHYTCNTCRHFIDKFGEVVTIDNNGRISSILWDDGVMPPVFRESVRAVKRVVECAKVTGVFLCEEKVWGTPSNKCIKPPFEWNHISVSPGSGLVHKPTVLKTTFQAMSELSENYKTLCRGLAEFPIDVVRQAHALLTTGYLYRSEKCIDVAKWLTELIESRERVGNNKENITWLAVARAPTNFCHIRSSMIGTLLEDIQSGMDSSEIKRRFDEKMDPLQYQRPQAAPTEGNVKQAEVIIDKLKSSGSLSRRFAKLEDLQTVWLPVSVQQSESRNGVFGHLKTKGQKKEKEKEIDVGVPPVTMTWEKFARTVLPEAESIEFFVPPGNHPFAALVTAANPDSPPILQWDSEEKRNQVSWYLYHGGTIAAWWNLASNNFHPVTAVALSPNLWGEKPLLHQGEMAFFILKGAKDTKYERGAGFFPEIMRSEYHQIRATLEAFARNEVVSSRDDATACGIVLSKGVTRWDYLFKVTSKGTKIVYKLDRWD